METPAVMSPKPKPPSKGTATFGRTENVSVTAQVQPAPTSIPSYENLSTSKFFYDFGFLMMLQKL